MFKHVPKEKNKSSTRQLKRVTSSNSVVLQDNRGINSLFSSSKQNAPIQKNNTGLPNNLKTGMENLSGMSLDHVKVHYNSNKPASVQAHAYAQGSEIHLASGQEKHLPHELGHVVQQAQGRVKPTTSVGGVAVNDNPGLENEATRMGEKALQRMNQYNANAHTTTARLSSSAPVQGYFFWKGEKIDSREAVEKKFTKLNLDSSKIKRSDKAVELEDRWKALIAMAETNNNEGSAANKDTLVPLVTNFRSQMKLLEAGISGSSDANKNISVSRMLESRDYHELGSKLAELVKVILATERAFPPENILKTAKNATGTQGSGFFVELNLGLNILKNRPAVFVQFGVVSPSLLKERFGVNAEKSTTKVKGLVGGDLTVWEPHATETAKHTFIQSKTATDKTLDENVMAAANQLASLTASGDPTGKSAQQEFSITGPTFQGVIFVLFTGNADIKKLAKTARSAMNKHKLFVHKVVYELIDGFFVVSSEQQDGKFTKENPLTEDVSGFSLPASSSKEEKGEKGKEPKHDEAVNLKHSVDTSETHSDNLISSSVLRDKLNKILAQHGYKKKDKFSKEVISTILKKLSEGVEKGVRPAAKKDAFLIDANLDLNSVLNVLVNSNLSIKVPIPVKLTDTKTDSADVIPAAKEKIKTNDALVMHEQRAQLERKGVKFTNGQIVLTLAIVFGFAALIFNLFY